MSSLYKFACFDCLVSFNRPALIKGNNYTAWLAESELKHVCPNCGKTLAFMGRNFRSPKRAAVSKWLASKLLWEAGFRYVLLDTPKGSETKYSTYLDTLSHAYLGEQDQQ